VADLPLTFLDHRIQCGNSLIGWALRDIPNDIPAEAYQTRAKTTGDDATKAACHSARERNIKALAGQGDLFASEAARPDIVLDFPTLWLEDERSPADVEKKATAYADYLASTPYRLWDAAADLWVASFFWIADYGETAPITTDYWRARELAERYRDGHLRDADVAGHLVSPIVVVAGAIAAQLNAFHWPLRFPEIAERGGFDLVTGNPPWEQVKLDPGEWFATRDVALARLPATQRAAGIRSLRNSNPGLYRAWIAASILDQRSAHFARESQRYPRTPGDENTYLLFFSLAVDSVRAQGRAGLVLKSGIVLDESGAPLLRLTLSSGRFEAAFDLVNQLPEGRAVEDDMSGGRPPIFPAVAAVERFSVCSLRGAGSEQRIRFSPLNWSVDSARARPVTEHSEDRVRLLSPRHAVLTSFPTEADLSVAELWAKAGPPLALEDEDNAWGAEFFRLFDADGKPARYWKREELEATGFEIGLDKILRAPTGDRALPLYEGQLANMLDHRSRTYEGYEGSSKYGKKPNVPWVAEVDKQSVEYEIEPRYWILEADAEPRLASTLRGRWPIGYRYTGRSWQDRRTARAALIPRYPATGKLPILALPVDHVFRFLAVFNSSTFDFFLRGRLAGSSISKTILDDVPFMLPANVPDRAAELARSLSVTSRSIASSYGMTLEEWSSDRRSRLADMDALVAAAAGLSLDDYARVQSSFVLERLMESAEGVDPLSTDLRLAAFRRLA
jgi:hypothetical protein